jgi:outer membrane protein, heavy metal efflux system
MIPSRHLLFLLCSVWVSGCQRYVPRPLDLDAYDQAIGVRDPSSSEVAKYARRLAVDSRAAPTHFDPADGLSLEEAEVVGLFFNPQLRAARLKARVPLVGVTEAGRWEDPHLRVDAERIIESVEHPWVLGGVLSLTLPLSGRLKADRQKATAEAGVEQLRVLVEEHRLMSDLRGSWLEWSATVEQVALTRALLAELDAIVQTAEKLRAAGELDPLDARLFRIERLTQAGRLQAFEAQAQGEELELKSRLGLAPAAEVKLIPSLNVAQPPFPSTQASAASLERHPRARFAHAEYEVAERTLELEIRKQYPDLSIGGGFGTDEGTDRVLGGIGLPLPLWNKNRRAIAEARAAREAARAVAEAEYEQLLADLGKARAALDAAAARLGFIESELAPLVDEQLAAARQLGRLGNYNTLVLLEALTAAYDAKFEVLHARQKLGLATARMKALVEPGLTEDGTGKESQP